VVKLAARNVWKLWRIGGMNLTVETLSPEIDFSSTTLTPKNSYPL
jgi:hypothetical protein